MTSKKENIKIDIKIETMDESPYAIRSFYYDRFAKSIFEENIIWTEDEYPFIQACKYNYIESANKYMVIFENDTSDILLKGFKLACIYGHVEIAERIYNIKQFKFKNLANEENIFTVACRNGHFEIVQFLYNVFPIDLSFNVYQGYRYALKFRNQKIIDWIKPLCEESMLFYPTITFYYYVHGTDTEY